MPLDSWFNDARRVRSIAARGPPAPALRSHSVNLDLFSSKFGYADAGANSGALRHKNGGLRMDSGGFGHGGARANSGGARPNSGGARTGAGRPCKQVAATKPLDVFRWYVVRTLHGQTDAADDDIREAGYEVVTAKICRPATRARRGASGSLIRATEESFVPLFVRYIIVSLNLNDPRWRDLLECEGVERIISGGHVSNNGIGIPISVPDAAIERLRKILSADGIFYPRGYKARVDDPDEPIVAGTSLRMGEYTGICEWSDGQRVMMLMNMFNRDNVRTTVAQSAVETA